MCWRGSGGVNLTEWAGCRVCIRRRRVAGFGPAIFVGAGGQDGDVGERLRVIGDPVVAGAPAGVRIRTRIHPTVAEAEALAAVGELLGSVYRRELAGRVGLGRLDHKAHAVWRAKRKQGLTAVSSSRWAGAITRAVEDQYQLGMRGSGRPGSERAPRRRCLESAVRVSSPGELVPVAKTANTGGPRRRSSAPVARAIADAAAAVRQDPAPGRVA